MNDTIWQEKNSFRLRMRDLVLVLDKTTLQFHLEQAGAALTTDSGITVRRFGEDAMQGMIEDYSRAAKAFSAEADQLAITVDDANSTYMMKWTLEPRADHLKWTCELADKKGEDSFASIDIALNPKTSDYLFTTWDLSKKAPICKLRENTVRGTVRPGFICCWQNGADRGWGFSKDFDDEEQVFHVEMSANEYSAHNLLSVHYSLSCKADSAIGVTTLMLSAHDLMDMFSQIVNEYPHVFRKGQSGKYPKLWGGMQKGDPGTELSESEKAWAREFYWLYVEEEGYESAPYYMPPAEGAWVPANSRTIKSLTPELHRESYRRMAALIPHCASHSNSRRISACHKDRFRDALALLKDGSTREWMVRDRTTAASHHPAYSLCAVSRENIARFIENYPWVDTVYIDNFLDWTAADYAHTEHDLFRHVYADETAPRRPLTHSFQHQTEWVKVMADYTRANGRLLVINATPLATQTRYADMAATDVSLEPDKFGLWLSSRFSTVAVPLNAKSYDIAAVDYAGQLKVCIAFGIIRSFSSYLLHKGKQIIGDDNLLRLHRFYSPYMNHLCNLEFDPSVGPHLHGDFEAQTLYAFAYRALDAESYIVSLYSYSSPFGSADKDVDLSVDTDARACVVVFNPDDSNVRAYADKGRARIAGSMKGKSCVLVLLRRSGEPVVVASSAACASRHYDAATRTLELGLDGGKGSYYQLAVHHDRPAVQAHEGEDVLDHLGDAAPASWERRGLWSDSGTCITYVRFRFPSDANKQKIRLRYG